MFPHLSGASSAAPWSPIQGFWWVGFMEGADPAPLSPFWPPCWVHDAGEQTLFAYERRMLLAPPVTLSQRGAPRNAFRPLAGELALAAPPARETRIPAGPLLGQLVWPHWSLTGDARTVIPDTAHQGAAPARGQGREGRLPSPLTDGADHRGSWLATSAASMVGRGEVPPPPRPPAQSPEDPGLKGGDPLPTPRLGAAPSARGLLAAGPPTPLDYPQSLAPRGLREDLAGPQVGLGAPGAGLEWRGRKAGGRKGLCPGRLGWHDGGR